MPIDSTGRGPGSDRVDDRTEPIDRVREWVLIDGSRVFIAGCLLAIALSLLLVLSELGLVAFADEDAITRLAGGMIAGSLSLVTIVVSINQLILSRELTSAGELRERIGSVMEFQADVESEAEVAASPAEPSELLALLAAAIRHRGTQLEESVADRDDRIAREQIGRYTDRVRAGSDELESVLESTGFVRFEAVSAVIKYNDSWYLHVGRNLRNEHEDGLSAESLDVFDDLLDALELFNVGRNYFKSTYMQRELTKFSRQMVYSGLCAVFAALLVGLVYADSGGATVDPGVLPYVTMGLVTVVLSPLALFGAYILRIATVSRRTASTGPILPEMDAEMEL